LFFLFTQSIPTGSAAFFTGTTEIFSRIEQHAHWKSQLNIHHLFGLIAKGAKAPLLEFGIQSELVLGGWVVFFTRLKFVNLDCTQCNIEYGRAAGIPGSAG
jgi:hypothetical protein